MYNLYRLRKIMEEFGSYRLKETINQVEIVIDNKQRELLKCYKDKNEIIDILTDEVLEKGVSKIIYEMIDPQLLILEQINECYKCHTDILLK